MKKIKGTNLLHVKSGELEKLGYAQKDGPAARGDLLRGADDLFIELSQDDIKSSKINVNPEKFIIWGRK